VKNECEDCHVDVRILRPASHTPDWLHAHRIEGRLNNPTCAACHTTKSSCQECHAGRLGEGIGTPLGMGKEGLVREKVHDLNYLFTHPIDAKGKETECATCHEPATDCAQCHEGVGRPIWHGGTDWIQSGGGVHAEQGRKDIERCAACHDLPGGDPTCRACHTTE
jgi:hypothetical protein